MLGLSFVLSTIIGIERQVHQKSAGLRTHVLVALGSTTFTLVSGLGFRGILGDTIILDPSRIAAGVVSGIGFLGAGVIFMRRDAVRGLTTAATVWVAAAVGMACGAGMPSVAIGVTVLHLVALLIFTPVVRKLDPPKKHRVLEVTFETGANTLNEVLDTVAEMNLNPSNVSTTTKLAGNKRVTAARMVFGEGPDLWKLAEKLGDQESLNSITVMDDGQRLT